MQNYKSERQRKLDNAQKELLTNYYLQKYNTIMSEIDKEPQINHHKTQINPIKQSQSKTQRLNFKNMILMKKNQNQFTSTRFSKINNSQTDRKKNNKEPPQKYSNREEQENQKTLRKLQQSIINQLYRHSPSRLEKGNYIKLEINSILKDSQEIKKDEQLLETMPQQNIVITREDPEEQVQQDSNSQRQEQEARMNKIRNAIKSQFQRRKDKSMSPEAKNVKASQAISSKISVQIKIQSPKKIQKVPTPNKYQADNKGSRIKNESWIESLQDPSSIKQSGLKNEVNNFESERPAVYFQKQFPADNNTNTRQELVNEELDIEFVPPSSDYYKSNNDDLVEEALKYQKDVHENHDKDSEKARSIASSHKSSSKQRQLQKSQSKKSIRSRKKSDIKDNSRMEMSFVSRMSMLSSEQGLLIKQKIQKELYQNELGPYQSALVSLLQLMQKNPRSGPVYAVGQKALDDRRNFEERRATQQSEISQLKKNIEKIKRKISRNRAMQYQDQQIQNNQLQILRLIRKVSTTL